MAFPFFFARKVMMVSALMMMMMMMMVMDYSGHEELSFPFLAMAQSAPAQSPIAPPPLFSYSTHNLPSSFSFLFPFLFASFGAAFLLH